MKKSSTFFLALALAAVAVLSACDSSNGAANGSQAAQAEPRETDINIRYVSRDSIMTQYIFAEKVRQDNERLEAELYALGNQLQGLAQNAQNAFQQKLQNNQFLNEQAAQAEYNKLQQQAQGYDRQLNNKQKEVLEKATANTKALNDSINNFIVDYIKVHPYDAILFREDVLFMNPALDITQEVVNGLNDRYKVVAEPAPAKK